MNPTHPNRIGNEPSSAEVTLRLIARLPAPEGIEDRIQAAIKASAPTARILAWPTSFQPAGSWMRGAAAAAIVFVVAGGGWGVYSRVQPPQAVKVLMMPPRAGTTSGFSTTTAVRTPQTLNGPVLAHPVMAEPLNEKVIGQPVKTPLRHAQSTVADKAAVHPAASPAN